MTAVSLNGKSRAGHGTLGGCLPRWRDSLAAHFFSYLSLPDSPSFSVSLALSYFPITIPHFYRRIKNSLRQFLTKAAGRGREEDEGGRISLFTGAGCGLLKAHRRDKGLRGRGPLSKAHN